MQHKSGIQITYDNSDNSNISCLCNVYFKIEGISQIKVAEIIKLENLKYLSFNDINNFLYPETDEIIRKANIEAIETIISPSINNWCYIIWTISWFDECRNIVLRLCKESKDRISCFFLDPWTAHYFWIIADKGTIIREFEYDDEIDTNNGLPICKEEKEFIHNLIASKSKDILSWIKNRKNPFTEIEDVYKALINKTGQHLEILNTVLDNSDNYISGTINIT